MDKKDICNQNWEEINEMGKKNLVPKIGDKINVDMSGYGSVYMAEAIVTLIDNEQQFPIQVKYVEGLKTTGRAGTHKYSEVREISK